MSEPTDSTSEHPVDSNEPDDPQSVIGSWQTVQLGGEDLPDDIVSTITFTDEGRLEGNGGVNRFGGTFELAGAELEFGPLFSTRMAGAEPAMSHENRLLRALEGRRAYMFGAGELVIGSGDEEVRLRRVEQLGGEGADTSVDAVDG